MQDSLCLVRAYTELFAFEESNTSQQAVEAALFELRIVTFGMM